MAFDQRKVARIMAGGIIFVVTSALWAQAPTPRELRRPGFRPRPDMLPGGPRSIFSNLRFFDTDGDGALSRQEYDAATGRVFALLDTNNDGKLDHTEMLQDVNRFLLEPATRSLQLMRLYDRNRDGKITADECLLPPKMFADVDTDKTGALENQDLINLTLVQATVLLEPARRAAALLAELDKNGDGKLTAKEFALGEEVFREADQDGDGLLDGDELETLPPLPPGHPRQRSADMIARLDQDGDKKLSPDEFRVPGGQFDEVDENKDGFVDLKELFTWFESGRGRQVAPRSPVDMVGRILERFDRDGDGKITEQERQGLPEPMWRRWDLNQDGVIEAEEIEKAFSSPREALPSRGP